MSKGPGEWVPKEAFVMPDLPASLKVDPLVAALVHVVAFLELSEDAAVDPDAAVEALESVQAYLDRLDGSKLESLRDQLARIGEHASAHGWPEDFGEVLASLGGEDEEGDDEGE